MRKPLVERFLIALAATFVFVSPTMNSIAVAEGTTTDSGQSKVTSQDSSEQPKVSEDKGQTKEQPTTQTPDSKGTTSSSDDATQQPAAQTPPASNDSSTKDNSQKGNPEQPRAPTPEKEDNKGNNGKDNQGTKPQTTKSNLAITKYDKDTGTKLAGAVFTVKAQDGSSNVTVTTNNSGFVNVNSLIVGKTYIITEIKAPIGYKALNTSKVHMVHQSHNTLAFYNEKEKPVEQFTTLTIAKKASDTQKPLAGAKFSVKAQDGSGTAKSVTTNANGIATVTSLVVGKKYTVEETNPPQGYIVSEGTKVITAGTEKYVQFLNSPKTPIPTKKGSVTIYKKDSDTGKLLQGATFALKQNGHKILSKTTGANGIVTFSGLDTTGSYTVEETNPPVGYQPATGEQKVTFGAQMKTGGGSHEVTTSLVFYNKKIVTPPTKKGSVTIYKKDSDTGKLLQGATFTLKQNGHKILSKTTGANGIVTFSGLDTTGSYTVEETNPPVGYQPATGEQKVTFGAQMKTNGGSHEVTTSLVFYNKKIVTPPEGKHRITIYKKDAADKKTPLAGAEFTLKLGDQVIGTKVTGSNGVVQFAGLAAGTYTVVETKAPAGYKALTTSQSVAIGGAYASTYSGDKGSNKDVVFYNEKEKPAKTGELTIVKKDKDSNALLAGAEFKVTNKATGEVVGSGITNEQGILVIKNLPVDATYTVEEVAAPAGYEKITGTQTVTIDSDKHKVKGKDKCAVSLVFFNKKKTTDEKGSVTLKKIDNDTGKALEGATFALFNEAGEKVAEKTTGADGYIEVTDLKPGTYYFQETKAPTGYKKIDTKFTVTVKDKKKDEHHNGNSVTVKNELEKNGLGVVKLQKTEKGTDKLLTGVQFKLYDADYKLVSDTVYTTQNGFITVTGLTLGETYYFQETKALDGYEPNTSFQKVVAGAEVTPGVVTMENEKTTPKVGAVGLTKKDAVTGNTLAGVKFNIVNKDTGDIIPVVTNEWGQINRGDLLMGNYYIEETGPLPGYEKNTEKIEFSLPNEKGSTDEEKYYPRFTMTNMPISTPTLYDATLLKIDSADHKLVLEGAVFGVYKAGSDEPVTKVTTGADGTARATGLEAGSYYFKELVPPAGYDKNEQSYPFTVGEDKAKGGDHHSKKIVVKNNKSTVEEDNGSASIRKVDEKGKVLQGATFQLYKGDEKVGEPIVTDNNGVAGVAKLAYGVYYFVETKAPEGYKLDSTPIKFMISKEHKEFTKTVKNEREKPDPHKGKASIKKVDEDGKPLAGAVFRLFTSDKTFVKEVTSGADGYAIVDNLEVGNYYFVETKAPAGYEADLTKMYSVEVKKHGGHSKVYAVNKLLPVETGSATLVKVGQNKQTLAGAVFQLYKDGEPYGDPMTTTTDGVIKVSDLAFGDYYFKEVTAPAGYVLNDKPIHFTLSEKDRTFEREVLNKKEVTPPVLGSATLMKVDSDTKEPLANATFELYKDGALYGTYTSDATGLVKASELPLGSYYFKETVQPAGYNLNSEIVNFTLTKDQLSFQREFANTKTVVVPPILKGNVVLTKTDVDTKKGLQGAVFELRNAQNVVVQSGLTTDATGKIIVKDLNAGTYSFIETVAPAGYKLNTDLVTFTVKTGDTVYVSKTNKLETGSVVLTKTDKKSGHVLMDATFKVVDATGKTVKEGLTTNAAGQIMVDQLAPGAYSFIETKAPAGYKLDVAPVAFTITADQTAAVQVTKTNDLERGSVVLTKVDEDSNAVLAGATFKLQDSGGNVVKADLVTNAAGQIVVNDLEPGDYYFIETKAPAGYKLDATPTKVTVAKGSNQLNYVTKTNKMITGTVMLTKVDGKTGETLAGVVFNLKRSDGTMLQQNLVTDSNGRITVSNLKPGTYAFVETKTLKGYKLNKTPMTFTITEDVTYPVLISFINWKAYEAPPEEPEEPSNPGTPGKPTTPTTPTTPSTSTGTNTPNNASAPTVKATTTYTNPPQASATPTTTAGTKSLLPQTGVGYATTAAAGMAIVLFAWWLIRRSRRAH